MPTTVSIEVHGYLLLVEIFLFQQILTMGQEKRYAQEQKKGVLLLEPYGIRGGQSLEPIVGRYILRDMLEDLQMLIGAGG